MTNRWKTASRVTKVLFSVAVLPGAVMNLVQPDVLVATAALIGVPLALMSLMGVWKLLGVVALWAPNAGRLREWAFAGFFFDLTGAAYLHVMAGDFAGAPPAIVLTALLVATYLIGAKAAAPADVNAAPGALQASGA